MFSPWDDSVRVQRLHVLWLKPERLPVNEIARQLNVTPGAVTSKARREGLPARQAPVGGRQKQTPLPRLTDTLPLIVGRRGPVARTTLPTLESVVGHETIRVVTTSLRAAPGRIGECCWPVTGQRPWLFCEAATVPGNRYCEKHREWSMHGSKGSATDENGAVQSSASTSVATGDASGESPGEAPTIFNGSESSDVIDATVVTADENTGELGAFGC